MIPAPIGVEPSTWAAMSPQQQLATSQQINSTLGNMGAPSGIAAYATGAAPAPAPPPMAHATPLPMMSAQPQAFQSAIPQLAPVAPPAAPQGAPASGPVVPYRQAPGGGTGDLTNKLLKTPGVAAHEAPLVDPTSQLRMQIGYGNAQAGLRGEANAERDVGAAAGAQGQAQASGLAGEAGTAGRAAGDLGSIAMSARERAAAHMAAADKFGAEIAGDKIDPDGMWNHASSGTQLRWTIARALGGFASGGTGPNQIADSLQHMADQDVASQKANFEARRGNLDSMYARAFRETGNADDALVRAKSYALTAAAKMTESLGAASGSNLSSAKANAIAAQLGTKSSELGVQAEKEHQAENKYVSAQAGSTIDILHDPRVQKEAADLQKSAAANGQPISPDEALKRAAETFYAGSQRGGYSSVQKLPAGAKGAQAQQGAALDDAISQARELRDAVKKGGELSPARTAELNTKAAGLAAAMRSATPGRPPPVNFFQGMIPSNPNGWDATGSHLAQMNAVVQHLEEQKRRGGGASGGASDVGFQPAEGDEP